MDAKTPNRTNAEPEILVKMTGLFFVSFILGASCLLALPALASEVTLEDDSLSIAFDSHSGALTRLADKTAHWTIERRPELGVSFRLFVPLPERRWNPVLGQKQSATEVKKISEHEIRFEWKNLASENGGILPMTLTTEATLTNGVLTFNATLENDSSLTIETIDYPYFGDFNSPTRASTNMAVWTMQHGNSEDLISNEIYPHFRNEKGYWGVFWPTKNLEAALSPFCLIQSSDKGVYVGVNAAESPYRLQYTFEQHPGLVSSVTSSVPQEDEIGGQPVHLEFRTCHFIFEKPHSRMKLAPIVLRFYRGNEHVGSALDKQTRSTTSK